jgi:hypothetical protein
MSTPRVESYRFGHIVIDEESYDQDVIILPDQVVSGWWREEGHRLVPKDLEAVFEADPEILVVGQGNSGRMKVLPETEQALRQRGIELVAAPTDHAVQTYNDLRTERQVAAALHLTC